MKLDSQKLCVSDSVTVLSSGDSEPEHSSGPVETEESVPGLQNISIRTGTVVPGRNDAISNWCQNLENLAL